MELDSDRKSHLWLMAPNALQCMPRIRYVGLDVVRPGMKYRWDAARHSRFNRSVIFQYTLSGQGRLTYRSQCHPLPRGTAFFCDSHTPDLVYDYPEDSTEPWEFLFVNLDGAERVGAEFLDRFGPVYPMGRSTFVETIRDHLRAPRQTQFLSPARMLGLVDLLLVELVTAGSTAGGLERSGRLVRRACEMIEARTGEALTVRALARELGVSREHLARLFMRELKTSPTEQINRVKMRRACLLLEDDTLPVCEVARRVGFGNPNHFARVFRRLVGVSPRAFRTHGRMPLP
jgi:AraC-like DNA-binding protein